MTQVGTVAFAADAWCHPTTVALMGMPMPTDALVADFTDGYMLSMTVTAGDSIVSEEGGNAGMCIMGEGTGAVCLMATAGDEDASLAANGLAVKMYAAGSYTAEGENDPATAVDLPVAAQAVLAPASVQNGPAPAATPEQIENEETPEPVEGQ
jgi:hypothetical protein